MSFLNCCFSTIDRTPADARPMHNCYQMPVRLLLGMEAGDTRWKVAALFLKYMISGLLIITVVGILPLISMHEEYVHQKLERRFDRIRAISLPPQPDGAIDALRTQVRELQERNGELRQLAADRQAQVVEAEGELIDLRNQVRPTATPETAKELEADWGANAPKTPRATDAGGIEALELQNRALLEQIALLRAGERRTLTSGSPVLTLGGGSSDGGSAAGATAS